MVTFNPNKCKIEPLTGSGYDPDKIEIQESTFKIGKEQFRYGTWTNLATDRVGFKMEKWTTVGWRYRDLP